MAVLSKPVVKLKTTDELMTLNQLEAKLIWKSDKRPPLSEETARNRASKLYQTMKDQIEDGKSVLETYLSVFDEYKALQFIKQVLDDEVARVRHFIPFSNSKVFNDYTDTSCMGCENVKQILS